MAEARRPTSGCDVQGLSAGSLRTNEQSRSAGSAVTRARIGIRRVNRQ